MSFKEEAIRRAEEAGYYPAEGQRPINWDVAEVSTDEYIIVGENNAVASGQHRILGGLMGSNPVPEEAMTRLTVPLPTQPRTD